MHLIGYHKNLYNLVVLAPHKIKSYLSSICPNVGQHSQDVVICLVQRHTILHPVMFE